MFFSKDENHDEIVSDLILVGCSVADLSQVGGGMTDTLVGFRGKNYLIEIKPEGMRNAKDGGLHKNQIDFHKTWQGHKCVVYNSMEAFKVIGITLEQAQELYNR